MSRADTVLEALVLATPKHQLSEGALEWIRDVSGRLLRKLPVGNNTKQAITMYLKLRSKKQKANKALHIAASNFKISDKALVRALRLLDLPKELRI